MESDKLQFQEITEFSKLNEVPVNPVEDFQDIVDVVARNSAHTGKRRLGQKRKRMGESAKDGTEEDRRHDRETSLHEHPAGEESQYD